MVLLIRSTHRFQSTLPVRGATRQLARRPDLGGNFNPRSPCGERQMFSPAPCGASGYFNPRSPCGERPRLPFLPRTFRAFQSTLPVRGATRLQGSVYFSALGISIHAPRAGSDNMDRRGAACLSNISIHAPRAGSDDDYPTVTMAADGISIHAPRAGSDCNGCGWNIPPRNFNPRSPCGERQQIR